MIATMPVVRVATLLLLIVLSGCATSGPKLAELIKTMPGVSAGQGRIYFYRDRNILGVALQPDIRVNGDIVGTSKPGGFFFVDLPPDEYVVSTTTEVENTIRFPLKSGETLYVRTYTSLGLLVGRVYPELVEQETALAAISDLHYIGSSDTPITDRPPRVSGPSAGNEAPRRTVDLDDLKGLLPK